MKHRVHVARTKVPQRRRIPGDTLANTGVPRSGGAFRAKARTTFADAKAQPISRPQARVMTSGTRDIAVSRKDAIIEKKLAQFGLRRINSNEIMRCQWARQLICQDGCRAKEEHMRKIAIALVFMAGPALAEIEQARDLMEAGAYEAAYDALWPAARSGNADAEELIGVLYALGLGVERDDVRAFEWYLRSSMKGHPGAQSGIGWYYEIGRGMPAPDLVRAYMWYTLSAIGGDPDAAISLEEVVKKMTQEEIDRAHILVADYKVWMYPFR